jgi:hypothetical protein
MNTPVGEIMRAGFRSVDGLRIRYAESDGPHDHTILLTNPWPESLYAFAPIWGRLARYAHLVAVDLPGFDGSERRDDLLCQSAMGEFVIRLIDAWGLDTPHLVGPDILFRTIPPRSSMTCPPLPSRTRPETVTTPASRCSRRLTCWIAPSSWAWSKS